MCVTEYCFLRQGLINNFFPQAGLIAGTKTEGLFVVVFVGFFFLSKVVNSLVAEELPRALSKYKI
jgi:hypothetical protein